MHLKKTIAKLPGFILFRGFATVIASFFVLLFANYALCGDQAACPLPVGWIVSDSFKFIFNRLIPFTPDFWFRLYIAWLGVAALASLLMLAIHFLANRNSGARARDSLASIRTLNAILAALYAPLWAGLLSLATLGFLGERKVFLLLLLLFSVAGLIQNICVRYLNSFVLRAVCALALAAAVMLLIPPIVSMPLLSFARGDLLYIAFIIIFLIVESGSGPADALRKSVPGADWFFRQFRTAFFLLAVTLISLPQINFHRRPPECSGISKPGSGVRVILDKFRSFTVATSYDGDYLYSASDYSENFYRVPLKHGGKPDSIHIGRFGAMRFREDRGSAVLFVPVYGLYPNSKLVIVDEKTFKIKKEILTPPWIGYQIFDMALDRTANEALTLGRYARVLFYRIGDAGFNRFADASGAFAGPEILGHKIMRIEVNESRRAAYICPYPALGSPRIIAELNLDTLAVTRTREFDSHPNVVRVIDGGKYLLVGLDMSQKILMLDADTLKTVRTYPAGFSVRDIAVDEKAGLMVAGNFLTGTVNLVRLRDGKLLKTWLVGRGVRSVHIDTRNNAAYAATLCGAVEMKLP
ncbi:MAG: hypothetical protein WCX65_03845 [bacterium]